MDCKGKQTIPQTVSEIMVSVMRMPDAHRDFFVYRLSQSLKAVIMTHIHGVMVEGWWRDRNGVRSEIRGNDSVRKSRMW